jgi:hypothetical protein
LAQHHVLLKDQIGQNTLPLSRRRVLTQVAWVIWMWVLVTGCELLMLMSLSQGERHRFSLSVLNNALVMFSQSLVSGVVAMLLVFVTQFTLRGLLLTQVGRCHVRVVLLRPQIRMGETVLRNAYLISRLSLPISVGMGAALFVFQQNEGWLLGIVLISLMSVRDFEALALFSVSSQVAVGETAHGDLLIYLPMDVQVPKLLL